MTRVADRASGRESATPLGSVRVDPVVRTLGKRLLADLPDLTTRLVDLIHAEAETYRQTPRVASEDLTRSCRDNLERLMQTLAATLPAGVDPYDAPRETGRRRAEQGLPLESLLQAYRLGGRVIWEALAAQTSGADGVSAERLLSAATWVWEVVDQFSSEVSRSYRDYQTARLRERDEHRRALLDALLDGRGGDPVTRAEAAEALGLPQRGTFLVAVAPYDRRSDPRAHPAPLRMSGGMPVGVRGAAVAHARHRLVLWELGEEPASALVQLRRRLSGPAGISGPFENLSEAGQARRLAETALRTLAPGDASVAWIDERLAEALLLGSPELARRLTRTHLGRLLAVETAERELLLATLEAWIAHGGSTAEAAKALACHRNTVLNRLRRLESLLAHRLDDTRHLVELSLAVRAARLLPAHD